MDINESIMVWSSEDINGKKKGTEPPSSISVVYLVASLVSVSRLIHVMHRAVVSHLRSAILVLTNTLTWLHALVK